MRISVFFEKVDFPLLLDLIATFTSKESGIRARHKCRYVRSPPPLMIYLQTKHKQMFQWLLGVLAGDGEAGLEDASCVVTSVGEGVVFKRCYYALAVAWRVLSQTHQRREGAGAVDQG